MSELSTLFPQLKDSLPAELKTMTLEPETVLLDEGNAVRNVPLVLKGSVRVMREDESGKEILLYNIRPGESCVMSILAATHHGTSQVRAVTGEETQIALVPAQQIAGPLRNQPAWNDFVLQLYQKRFEELLHVISELAFRRVDERLRELLLKKAENHTNVELQTTHQQLADELGTAREVVSRLLKILETDGKVRLSRGIVKILSAL